MCKIVKEYDMKNINQNIYNNEYKILDNEVLENTKLLNRIFVLVANRSKRQKPEWLAFSQPSKKNII